MRQHHNVYAGRGRPLWPAVNDKRRACENARKIRAAVSESARGDRLLARDREERLAHPCIKDAHAMKFLRSTRRQQYMYFLHPPTSIIH